MGRPPKGSTLRDCIQEPEEDLDSDEDDDYDHEDGEDNNDEEEGNTHMTS